MILFPLHTLHSTGVGSCKTCHKHSGSIKGDEYLDQMSEYQFLKTDLNTMGLVHQ